MKKLLFSNINIFFFLSSLLLSGSCLSSEKNNFLAIKHWVKTIYLQAQYAQLSPTTDEGSSSSDSTPPSIETHYKKLNGKNFKYHTKKNTIFYDAEKNYENTKYVKNKKIESSEQSNDTLRFNEPVHDSFKPVLENINNKKPSEKDSVFSFFSNLLFDAFEHDSCEQFDGNVSWWANQIRLLKLNNKVAVLYHAYTEAQKKEDNTFETANTAYQTKKQYASLLKGASILFGISALGLTGGSLFKKINNSWLTFATIIACAGTSIGTFLTANWLHQNAHKPSKTYASSRAFDEKNKLLNNFKNNISDCYQNELATFPKHLSPDKDRYERYQTLGLGIKKDSPTVLWARICAERKIHPVEMLEANNKKLESTEYTAQDWANAWQYNNETVDVFYAFFRLFNANNIVGPCHDELKQSGNFYCTLIPELRHSKWY